MADHVVVVPYDARWPDAFLSETRALEAALADRDLAFQHIGSTAVAGMAAKPTIDLMIGAPRAGVDAAVLKAFAGLGYGYLGEYGVPGREFFRKGLPPTYHVHWVERGGAFWSDQLLFRDFMRVHPAQCAAYERVKRELAERFSQDRKSYTASKSTLIAQLMDLARSSAGLRRIVVDLEATCWETGTNVERQEIIEIGAVELDTELKVLRELDLFARPVQAPVLSDFCRELTGIKQEDVSAAGVFAEVFPRFTAWAGPAPFELASWGEYDLRQFHVDCARAGLPVPEGFTRHIDLRALFARRRGLAAGTMTQALAALGLEQEGRLHRALDDARNVARLAQVLLRP